jgi:prephenate dehydrogenase
LKKIAIFGVGLMGGSLALIFKGKYDHYVVGHSPSQTSVEKYLKRGVVDHATTSFEEAASEADFIFLCVPVGNMEEYMRRLTSLPLKKGCIVTDVGSTKGSICAFAQSLDWQEAVFIGGHPMAGSERAGVEAASSHLYENAFYVLTPSANVDESAYDRLVDLLRLTKAQLVRVGAGEHDAIVGAVSHLPHVIAAALVNMIARRSEHNPLYQQLAAGGFRDITRIASSELLWWDILLDNRDVMLGLLDEWVQTAETFKALIAAGDRDALAGEFAAARHFRSTLPERRKGMITSLYDIYVDVPDHPGVIAHITSLLGDHKINLSNIHIIESRADVPGVLRLSFRNEHDMDRAKELLKTEYEVRI